MSINLSDNNPRIEYSVAEGVTQTSFAVPFEFFDDSDVVIYVDGTLKTEGVDYTLTGGDGSTGTATISVTGATGGSVVIIFRSIALERVTDFTAGSDINRAALNQQLDSLVAMSADLDDRVDRSIHLPDADPSDSSFELPVKSVRAGKFMSFGTDGELEMNDGIAFESSPVFETVNITNKAGINIGTDTPSAKLEVGGNGNSVRLSGVDANNTGGIEFYRGDGQTAAIFGTTGSSGRLGIKSDPDNVLTNSHIDFEIDGNQIATFTSNGNFGLGTTTPAKPLEVFGDGNSVRLTGDGANNTGGIEFYRGDGVTAARFSTFGSSGRFGIKSDPDNLLADSHIDFEIDGTQVATFTSNGNLGLGTETPAKPLEVFGDGNSVRLTGDGADNTGGLEFYRGDGEIAAQFGTTGSSGKLRIKSDPSNTLTNSKIVFEVDGSEVGAFDTTGFFGVGTDAPQAPFHAVSSSGSGMRVEATTNDTAGGIQFYGRTNDTTYYAGDINSRGQTGTLQLSADPDNLQADSALALRVDGTTHLRIIEGGNVGIGTINPTVPLDVVGDAAFSSKIKVGTDADANINADDLSVSKDQTNVGISILSEDTTGESRLLFGTQTDTSAAKVQYVASSDEIILQSGGIVTLQSGGTNDRVTIDSSGNVGIGNTSPSVTLDLTGEAAISNKVKIGTGADANINADELVVSKDINNVGMSLLAADTTGVVRLYLGSQTDTTAASIRHSESNDRLFLQSKGDIYFQTTGNSTIATLNSSGDLDVTGALSKGSGSFKIDHPLKPDTHHLVHSFLEGPQADNIYRGTVALVGGAATVNLDTAGRMTEGTFVALNGNVQCFTSNEQGWTAVRGSVSGNLLTIEAQDAACTDTVSWMVIGERKDQHMIDTHWTDAAGRVITEPEKPSVEEEDAE
jgi:hypothetical protein